jgi:2-polyprenyl-3-methyl-5-hydroxy-6-metoxy-1,4-benzoquinol methylase
MLDYDPLAGYRDAQAYDLEDGDYDEDRPFIEQWARTLSGPILDLACGTGTMAIKLAAQGYPVNGLDIVPEMIAWAAQKAAAQQLSIDWLVADARAFHLGKQFPLITLLGNAFQHFLTRADHEALFARVREHLTPEGRFIFCTRNPCPRNLLEARFSEPQQYSNDDGGHLLAAEHQHYDSITQIQHYTFHNQWYSAAGQLLREETFRTALRYVFPQEMEALLHYNGFHITAVYGSWQQDALTPDSRLMIYVCQPHPSV